MPDMSRRDCIQAMLAGLTAAASPPTVQADLTTPMRKNLNANRRGIQLAELFAVEDDHKIRLARQIGITHAIAAVLPSLKRVQREDYVQTLEKIESDFQAAGMAIAGVESHPVPAEEIKLGLPGRDEEIEN